MQTKDEMYSLHFVTMSVQIVSDASCTPFYATPSARKETVLLRVIKLLTTYRFIVSEDVICFESSKKGH